MSDISPTVQVALAIIPMYVKRYARTIHGALTKSSRSCDIVTKDVDTIEVSRLEKRSPVSNLQRESELEAAGGR